MHPSRLSAGLCPVTHDEALPYPQSKNPSIQEPGMRRIGRHFQRAAFGIVEEDLPQTAAALPVLAVRDALGLEPLDNVIEIAGGKSQVIVAA